MLYALEDNINLKFVQIHLLIKTVQKNVIKSLKQLIIIKNLIKPDTVWF